MNGRYEKPKLEKYDELQLVTVQAPPPTGSGAGDQQEP